MFLKTRLKDSYSSFYLHPQVRYTEARKCSKEPLEALFGALGPRCWTGSSMLDCHVLKGFGIYMIGILGSLY